MNHSQSFTALACIYLGCNAQAKSADQSTDNSFTMRSICQRGDHSDFWFVSNFQMRDTSSPDDQRLSRSVGLPARWEEVFAAHCDKEFGWDEGDCRIIRLEHPNPNKPMVALPVSIGNRRIAGKYVPARIMADNWKMAQLESDGRVFTIDFVAGKITTTWSSSGSPHRDVGEADCTVGNSAGSRIPTSR
jgi:hypothetical protein